jgi:hypothetical protein
MQKNFEEYEKIGNFIEKKIIPDTQKLKTLGFEISSQDIDKEETEINKYFDSE